MSILGDIEPSLSLVGHYYDVNDLGFDNFPGIRINGQWHYPDYSLLSGLLGKRKSTMEYYRQLLRYVCAAWMTCYVDGDGTIRPGDDRFNKIIRMVNAAYRVPMGTLDVELCLSPQETTSRVVNSIFRVYFKGENNSLWGNNIIHTVLREPDIYRGRDKFVGFHEVDHTYYGVKPQAIKTHMRYMERLLNYNIENNILNQ